MRLIDLSQAIEEDMSVFPSLPRPRITAYFTHAESLPHYEGGTCFEVTRVDMVTSLGTYLDAPYHRYPEGAAIDCLALGQCVLPGVVVDTRAKGPREPIGVADLPEADLGGGAVLFCTGWDRYWSEPAYHQHPFLSADAVEALLEQAPSLVGIDTLNIDNPQDRTRPAHTQLLGHNILIVENLCGLEQLVGQPFLFVAAPVKVRGAAAFPVRAFALANWR
jgi:arylformamidase